MRYRADVWHAPRRVWRVVCFLLLAGCRSGEVDASSPIVVPTDVATPASPGRIAFADTLHGSVVADSLRYLEDTTRTEVRLWLQAESTYTALVLSRLVGRDSLSARVERILNTMPTLDRVRDTPARLFIIRWIGESPSLLAIDNGATSERMLLPDSLLRRRRNGASLRALSPSWDGRYVAIGTTEQGDVNAAISVVDANSGVLLDDVIPDLLTTTSGTRYEVTWLPDNSGFIYPRRWPGSDRGATTELLARGRQFLHRLGTPQSADVPLFGFDVYGSPSLATIDLPTRVLTAPGSPWSMASVFRSRENGTD
jgi:prolyl oligopeptidase